MTEAKKAWKDTPQGKYFRNQKQDGYVRIAVWLPSEARPELLKAAQELRQKYLRAPEGA